MSKAESTDTVYNLIEHAKTDSTEFEQLVRHFQPFVYSVALRLLLNEQDAKDLVQECFIRVWKHLHRFDHSSKFTTWLYQITLRLALDSLKGHKRRQKALQLYGKTEATKDEHCSADTAIQKQEWFAQFRKVADALPPRQRIIFVLRDLEDLDLQEIAKMLSLSVNTVKSNLYYARKHLRELIQQRNSYEMS